MEKDKEDERHQERGQVLKETVGCGCFTLYKSDEFKRGDNKPSGHIEKKGECKDEFEKYRIIGTQCIDCECYKCFKKTNWICIYVEVGEIQHISCHNHFRYSEIPFNNSNIE